MRYIRRNGRWMPSDAGRCIGKRSDRIASERSTIPFEAELVCRATDIRGFSTSRRGAMLPFLAICMVFIVGMMAFAVDVSYMHMLRAEIRLASDAAARAGTETLRRTQSPEKALKAAIDIASLNQIAGKPVKLAPEDVQFGQTQYKCDGSWEFKEGETPFQAMRITVKFGKGSPNSEVPTFFGKFWGVKSLAANSESVASHLDQDLVLCLDRSHSMCFDLSGVDWVYPPETLQRKKDPYLLKPGNKNSRWASLQRSVSDFMDECGQVNSKPHVALVTWASEITEKGGENLPNIFTSPRVTRESTFTTNFNQLLNKTLGHGNTAMFGGTELSSGLRESISMLTGNDARALASKSVILMTDGQWNLGIDPVIVAQEAVDAGITIHTITFLPDAMSNEMATVASMTGGRHYHANNESELREAFRELARLLPVVLTN